MTALDYDCEKIYQTLQKVIEEINVTIESFEIGSDLLARPEEGDVAFGSIENQWCFTLTTFAETYSKKFGIDRQKMRRNLWGDRYFSPTEKKWLN